MQLRADSIRVSYGDRQILSDVFLSCSIGEIVGLLGRNGSGKSTLLKVLNRSVLPTDSFVKVGEKVLLSSKDCVNSIAYLAQDSFLPKGERVSTVLRCYLSEEAYQKQISTPFVARIVQSKTQDLSGGEKRYLEVLMLLNARAPFILLDEPFAGLAPVARDKIKEEIKQVARYKGIIVTDHDYRNILDICSKTILMRNGKSIPIQDKKDLTQYGYLPSF